MNSPQNSNRFMFFLILINIFIPLFISIIFLALFPNAVENANYVLIILIMSSFCTTILPLMIYSVFTRQSIFELIPLKKLSFRNISYIVLLTFLLQPVGMFVSALTGIFFNNDAADALQILSKASIWQMLISAALVPAVCEELIFRGVLLTGYKQNSRFAGAFITALFFAIMHLNPHQFFYAFILGFVFTYFVYYTKSIFASMLAHFIINGTSVFTIYILKIYSNIETQANALSEMSLKQQLQQIGIIGIYAFFCSILFYIVFKSFKHYNEQRKLKFMIPINRSAPVKTPKIITPCFIAIIIVYILYMSVNYIIFPIIKKYI